MNIAQKLIDLAPKIKKDLLVAPMTGLAKALPHMNVVPGVRGWYIGGLLSADAEFRPYVTAKGTTDGAVNIESLEMMNYLGDVLVEFDPNAILNSIYGESIKKGMTELQIVAKVALVLAKKAGEKLFKNMFTAVRNPAGANTAALFNGFTTLVNALIVANKITVPLENLADTTATPMTTVNCGDILKAFVREADEYLTETESLKLFLPKAILHMYEDWYQIEHGVAPFNTSVLQKTLVGFENVEFVTLSNLKNSNFMYLTVKNNMNILVDTQSDTETALIRQPDNPKVVQFFMMAWFGVGFETVQKEFFKALKFA